MPADKFILVRRLKAQVTGRGKQKLTIGKLCLTTWELFNLNTTSKTGFGGTLFPIAPNTAIGNYQLTAGLQTLFERLGNDNYAENRYLIFAKEVSNKAIQFVIQFQDQDVGDPNVDESIPGILVSKVQLRRPTGSYVNVPAPSYSMQSSLEVGD